ncbi:hypothetical protein Ancab_012793 [Ancistrocladus abbreviatus]
MLLKWWRFSATAMAAVVFSLFFLLAYPSLNGAVGASESENISTTFEWEILTARNFSSQIRLHPCILLFVTVPWSGESCSLMMELSRELANGGQEFGSLKLRILYSNHENFLANSLGATEGITILCYYHAVSYKYQGRRKAQDILYSFSYLMSLEPEELPLKTIDSSEALEAFLPSTDKSVLLLETCGWTRKLLEQQSGNRTAEGGLFPSDFSKETNRTLTCGGLKNLKDIGNENWMCGVGSGLCGSSWVGEFSVENSTSPSLETDSMESSVGSSCSFAEYQKFNSFFSKLTTIARNFFLPPQRQRYGLVSERSLLSSLGVEDSGPWSLVIYHAGCCSCSKVLKEETKIQDALATNNSPFMVLAGDEQDVELTLPVDKPSAILFVDRSSQSLEIRQKSKEALDAFREVALQYWNSSEIDGGHTNWPKKYPIRAHQGSRIVQRDQRLLLSPLSQTMKIKDKVSVMIVNEGKHVTVDNLGSDLQGGPLHEILTYLLGQKKQEKLSTIAKEAGFQLLSDDIDIKITDALSGQKEGQSNLDTLEPSREGPTGSVDNIDENQNLKIPSLSVSKELPDSTDVEPSYEFHEEKTVKVLASKHSTIETPDPLFKDRESYLLEDANSEKETYVHSDKLVEQQNDIPGFGGSFFYSDGNYQLLRSLTGDSRLPRMVIIDPISEHHYIFAEVTDLSYYSISDFISRFLNGSLLPYQRSGVLQSPRESPHPPFVNLDFHEKDSIPHVTTNTFSEFVLGSSQSDAQNATNALNKDVLVLFSNSWCGFCQRTELVVREVYRALKGYKNMIIGGPQNRKLVTANENKGGFMSELPLIYQIDCTLNECSMILRSMNQQDFYPSLLLFPAETKTAVPYEGDMTVTDIIKFIASSGRSSHNLMGQKGILWTETEKRDENQDSLKRTPSDVSDEKSSDAKEKYYEVLKGRYLQNEVTYRKIQSQMSKDSDVSVHNVAVGSFLIATDKLLGTSPFGNARILIVSADLITGFQGLIINKHINWETLPGLENVELLKVSQLSYGGPVIHHELPLVTLTRKVPRDHRPEVLPGVYFLDQVATIHNIEEINAGNQSAKDYWFFLGYSGWGWGQLFNEIADGVWSLYDGSVEDLHWP